MMSIIKIIKNNISIIFIIFYKELCADALEILPVSTVHVFNKEESLLYYIYYVHYFDVCKLQGHPKVSILSILHVPNHAKNRCRKQNLAFGMDDCNMCPS
jgi:hypothetical protein